MKHTEFDFSRQMPIDSYMEERVLFNTKRYRAKSTMCRETYLYSSLAAIVLGSLIPILINMDISKRIPTVISFIVVILVGMENVFHFRERWKNYQIAEELLRRERYLFQTLTAPYAKLELGDSYALLVTNVEAIIKSERDKTIQARSSEIKLGRHQSEHNTGMSTRTAE